MITIFLLSIEMLHKMVTLQTENLAEAKRAINRCL